jgi:hypothetical protein
LEPAAPVAPRRLRRRRRPLRHRHRPAGGAERELPVGAAPRARAARRRTFRLAARAGRRGGVRVERIGGIG